MDCVDPCVDLCRHGPISSCTTVSHSLPGCATTPYRPVCVTWHVASLSASPFPPLACSRQLSRPAPYTPSPLGSCRVGFGLVGLEHPAFKGDAEEGPMVHFFVGHWSPSGGGQQVRALMGQAVEAVAASVQDAMGWEWDWVGGNRCRMRWGGTRVRVGT